MAGAHQHVRLEREILIDDALRFAARFGMDTERARRCIVNRGRRDDVLRRGSRASVLGRVMRRVVCMMRSDRLRGVPNEGPPARIP
jgi:hypothetical protein